MIAHCAERLARFKVPHAVVFVDTWPMSATKIHKPTLVARAANVESYTESQR